MHLAIHNLTASQLRDKLLNNFTILTTEPIVIFISQKLRYL